MTRDSTAPRASSPGLIRALSSVALLGLAAFAAEPARTVADFSLERALQAETGNGVPRDTAAAVAWYRNAAAAGNALAHFRLGYLTEIGDGAPQDYFAARRHYQAAADAGLHEARLRLAICHLEGWGGPVDREAFVKELRAAADADHAPAQRILAAINFLGLAVPVNRAEGVKWLERAAALDDELAQVALGQKIESARRQALAPDLALARNWYQLSAEQEYREGMRAMARTFLTGARNDRNWALGQHWLQLAVEAGDAEAPYILAICELLHMDAPNPDETKARAWLTTASERGNERATEVLQLEIRGRALRDAMNYVLSVPFEDRYVQTDARGAGDAPTRRPVVYRVVRPIYPESLRFTANEGEVLVDFVVDSTGRVTKAKVLRGSHPLFGVRALEAVQQWRFHPGRKEGRLVNTHMQVPVIFQLNEEGMEGVDGLLRQARDRATTMGPAVLADASDLRFAEPRGPIPPPQIAGGAAAPADVAVVVLLALDKNGRPLRGHILEARPEHMGPPVLASALGHAFVPRVINGEAVASNVLTVYLTGRYQAPIAPRGR